MTALLLESTPDMLADVAGEPGLRRIRGKVQKIGILISATSIRRITEPKPPSRTEARQTAQVGPPAPTPSVGFN